MAIVDDTGITPTTLTEYQTRIQNIYKAAYGENIDLGSKSPQAQQIDNESLSMSQADDALVDASQAINIYRAYGNQLEGQASLLGINKRAATSTLVTVTLGGTPAIIIPSGSRARSDSGDLFETTEDLQLDVLGALSASMSAVETGPLEVLTGELTQIVDVIPGWETVINPSDGAVGTVVETDAEYRQRYFTELFTNAVSVLEAIVSQVSEQDNVIEVIGVENDTGSPIVIQNITVDAHSVAIVVEGGIDEDIKDAIRLKKTGGTVTTGTTTVLDPPNQPINFFRVDFIDAEITITTTPGTNFPNNGITLLKQRTFDYINGEISGDPGPDFQDFFEIDGMTISEDLDKNRLYTPINSVQGHVVSGLTLQDKASPGDVQILTTDLDEKIQAASLDDINVVLL